VAVAVWAVATVAVLPVGAARRAEVDPPAPRAVAAVPAASGPTIARATGAVMASGVGPARGHLVVSLVRRGELDAEVMIATGAPAAADTLATFSGRTLARPTVERPGG